MKRWGVVAARALAVVGAILTPITLMAPSAMADPAPATPVLESATAADGRIDVSWLPTTPTGQAVMAMASPGGATCESVTSGCSLTGLTDGTTYTVTLTTIAGGASSPPSVPSDPVTPVDLTPPDVDGWSISPTTLPLGGGQVTVSARMTDATSGVDETAPSVQLLNRNGDAVSSAPLTLQSGDATDGQYAATLSVPGDAQKSLWSTAIVGVKDQAGNARDIVPLDQWIQTGIPAPPTHVAAAVEGRSIHVTWNPSPTGNGQPITGYTVEARDVDWRSVVASVGPGDTSADLLLGDLTSTTMFVSVTASTAMDSSPGAAAPGSVTVLPAPPDTPQAQGTAGDGQVVITWTAPHTNGASISAYTVLLEPGGQVCTRATVGDCAFEVANGTTYTASVTAANAAGVSGASTLSSLDPHGPPPPPTGVNASVRDARAVRVTWSDSPTDPGGLTGFEVEFGPVGGPYRTAIVPAAQRSLTINGSDVQTPIVPNIPYAFRVTAIGPSLRSVPIEAPQHPSLPDLHRRPNTMPRPTVTSQDRSTATLHWARATAPGGTAITGYLVRIWNGTTLIRATALRPTARHDREIDLPFGQHYRARIYAINQAGTSAASPASPFRLRLG